MQGLSNVETLKSTKCLILKKSVTVQNFVSHEQSFKVDFFFLNT